jgi:hypothetical protein
VNVAVGFAVVVGVSVGVKEAAPPPQEQPRGERGDDEPDQGLGGLLDGLWQVAVKEDQRQPDEDERRTVPRPPEEAHDPGFTQLLVVFLRGDERRNRCQVVRVARVPQAQERAYEQDAPKARGIVHKAFEPAVYRAHALLPSLVVERRPPKLAVLLPGEVLSG